MKWKSAGKIARETVSEFFDDNALRLSAALAYYAVFSLGPLLMIIMGVASLVFGATAVKEELQTQLSGLIGPEAAGLINTMTSAKEEAQSLTATIIGVVALLFGATGLFGQLQDALNTIWEVKPKPGRGVWGFIRTRFLSFAMVLGIGFLLLVSMVLSTVLQLFSKTLEQWLQIPEPAFQLLHYAIAFSVITALFAMIYKVLPDVTVQWRDVWVGAIGTALLFSLGKYGISAYLAKSASASAFGAAGALVIVLLWVYYSSVILFFGAEFTQVYAAHRGAKILPSKNAVPVSEQQRLNEGLTRGAAPEPQVQHSPAQSTRPAFLRPSLSRPHTGLAHSISSVRTSTIAISVAILAGQWFLQRKIARALRKRIFGM